MGEKEIEVSVENPTVFGLIEVMTNTYGVRFRLAILDASRKLRVIVTKNDQETEFPQGSGTPLRDGDRVMFVPPVAAGWVS